MNIPWRLYEKLGDAGLRLIGEFDVKSQLVKVMMSKARGTIVRLPGTRDYVINTSDAK